MKRAAVLLTVLTMTSLAGAEIQISVNGVPGVDEISLVVSEVITIGIYNFGGDTPIDFLCYLDFSDYYEFSLSNPRLGPAAGDGIPDWVGPVLYDDYEEIEFAQSWQPGSTEIPGDMFLIDMHDEGMSDSIVTLWDERVGFDEPVDTLIIHHGVPEPATIALLALGTLFLRKYKK